jgi:hypothetical protein
LKKYPVDWGAFSAKTLPENLFMVIAHNEMLIDVLGDGY